MEDQERQYNDVDPKGSKGDIGQPSQKTQPDKTFAVFGSLFDSHASSLESGIIPNKLAPFV
jgi:hypothetical protein